MPAVARGARDVGRLPTLLLSRRHGRGRYRETHRQPATLYDAHWYAATRLENHQLSYTTTDALIDDYFASHADALPAALTVAEIRSAARTMTRAEIEAVDALTAASRPRRAIPLTGYVDADNAADAKLANAREPSSAERNSMTRCLQLMLPLLARRAAYGALRVEDPRSRRLDCERQSLTRFLRTSAAK